MIMYFNTDIFCLSLYNDQIKNPNMDFSSVLIKVKLYCIEWGPFKSIIIFIHITIGMQP